MKNVLKALIALSLLTGVAAVSLAPTASAATVVDCSQDAFKGSPYCEKKDTDLFGKDGVFIAVINTLLFIVGILAVIMLIIGGMRYTLSAGDSNAVNGAKNTILYSVIGVVVAFAAYAIVNFVVVRLL